MTLARRMAFQIGALLVSLVLLAAASLWGISGLNQNVEQALLRYEQLRETLEIGASVRAAQDALTMRPPDSVAARNLSLQTAGRAEMLLQKLDRVPMSGTDLAVQQWGASAILDHLRNVAHRLAVDAPATRPSETADLRAELRGVLSNLAELSTLTTRGIREVQTRSVERVHATLIVIGALSAAIILSSVLVGLWQYWGVMSPLQRLTRGVRSIAAGRFSQRLPTVGDEEFVRLAQDFNRMAEELDELYRELENKVALKSKELVRSERLASVGFLAAGVAHEINNPLGIIAGYAELSLRHLEKSAGEGPPSPAAAQAVRSLRIICDEAFRCKQITERMLTLARPGSGRRQVVALPAVAEDVRALLAGLPRFRDRQLTLRFDADGALTIHADPTEMKQVLLNLTVNALEATDVRTGQVVLAGRRDGDQVELTVTDNGRGMSPQTLEHVFEPFFTEKRGTVEGGPASPSDASATPTAANAPASGDATSAPGTGLGLSIVHAIVESHGGQIRAHSDGPGQGSHFTIRFPAARSSASP